LEFTKGMLKGSIKPENKLGKQKPSREGVNWMGAVSGSA
jgi:hypothetical protein